MKLAACIALFQAEIVVGPVIGEVSESTARVLLEVNASTEVSISLTPPDGAPGAWRIPACLVVLAH
jgi:hypothetical protein